MDLMLPPTPCGLNQRNSDEKTNTDISAGSCAGLSGTDHHQY
jgi:hypothetical protein